MDSLIINKIKKILNKTKIVLVKFCCSLGKYFLNFNGFKVKNNWVKNDQNQINLDKKLVYFLSKTRWPSFKQLKHVGRYLTKWELRIVNGCFFVILIGLIFISVNFYNKHLQNLPINGGNYIEGMVGAPKHINPLYASVSDVDNNIAYLIFSSLFKRDKNGELINDLVESYQVSQDNKNYSIKIKTKVNWHNDSSLTVDDIVFTFNAIKDAQYMSSLRTSFVGVELKAINDNTVEFILNEPYAGFLDLLTFGILPQELWQQIAPSAANLAELNLKPIGSGPYKFKSLVKDKSGNIWAYTLIKNDNYYGQIPYIEEITFKFFNSFSELLSALNDNLIHGVNYLPYQFQGEVVVQSFLNFFQLRLPQSTTIFFNPKANVALSDKKVRQALAFALDKNKIVNQIYKQNALIIDGPILPDSFAYDTNIKKYNYNIATATKLLDEAGWQIVKINQEDINNAETEIKSTDEKIRKKAEQKIFLGVGEWRAKNNEYLIIELVTADMPEYAKAVEEIAKFWQVIKIKTTINLVQANKIQSQIIKQRDFVALLYGGLAGADPDPYAFWHSLQIDQAGLNITSYANKEVDQLLEDARLISDKNVRRDKYIKFQEILVEEAPAIFLYSPNYIYIQAKKIKGFDVKKIIMPHDRFSNIESWYIKTGKKLIL
ncbi:MAG: peptide ABC transporter substrate-binding protein [Patescibacteria group bacterium]|nr:peptide ABC transporter substrate-binding protein [Patescibacteria group bacterium]MBU1870875.1 peptide ABC transporter substrate-binding protein [Patescibacteria group bacterium]